MPKNMELETTKYHFGFTLVEILVVMSIMAILFGFSSINLTNLIPKAQLTSSSDILLADLKQQQIKAMSGDTEGRAAASSYGIYFDTTSYTVFYGSTYNPTEPSNVTIDLEKVQLENISFPNSTIVFEPGSGEVDGLASGTYSFTSRDTSTSKQEIITINKLGVLSVN